MSIGDIGIRCVATIIVIVVAALVIVLIIEKNWK